MLIPLGIAQCLPRRVSIQVHKSRDCKKLRLVFEEPLTFITKEKLLLVSILNVVTLTNVVIMEFKHIHGS